MAHFAQLDKFDTVIQVIVVHNNELLDYYGNESEAKGIAFCRTIFGEDTRWVQTSYNGNKRKNFAGIGYTYDPSREAFIAPKPSSLAILNEDTCQWEIPVPKPADYLPATHHWDEKKKNWVKA